MAELVRFNLNKGDHLLIWREKVTRKNLDIRFLENLRTKANCFFVFFVEHQLQQIDGFIRQRRRRFAVASEKLKQYIDLNSLWRGGERLKLLLHRLEDLSSQLAVFETRER
jgi:hypothetical protein